MNILEIVSTIKFKINPNLGGADVDNSFQHTEVHVLVSVGGDFEQHKNISANLTEVGKEPGQTPEARRRSQKY